MNSNFTSQQERAKREKEKDNTRREKLAGYFFDLSKLIFAAIVLGGLTPLFTDSYNNTNWLSILFGAISTFFFAFFANKILK